MFLAIFVFTQKGFAGALGFFVLFLLEYFSFSHEYLFSDSLVRANMLLSCGFYPAPAPPLSHHRTGALARDRAPRCRATARVLAYPAMQTRACAQTNARAEGRT